jgi:hypothetical protein
MYTNSGGQALTHRILREASGKEEDCEKRQLQRPGRIALPAGRGHEAIQGVLIPDR